MATYPAMAPIRLLATLALTATATAATPQGDPTTEFGTIAWQRDYAAAIAAAKQASMPVLLLFQEVPG